ncbi:MAG: hypothetical protein J2P30_26470, partial [Actinobacteria bacterium]|nr:hypothetical protein [Actinomycetota bacterium]
LLAAHRIRSELARNPTATLSARTQAALGERWRTHPRFPGRILDAFATWPHWDELTPDTLGTLGRDRLLADAIHAATARGMTPRQVAHLLGISRRQVRAALGETTTARGRPLWRRVLIRALLVLAAQPVLLLLTATRAAGAPAGGGGVPWAVLPDGHLATVWLAVAVTVVVSAAASALPPVIRRIRGPPARRGRAALGTARTSTPDQIVVPGPPPPPPPPPGRGPIPAAPLWPPPGPPNDDHHRRHRRASWRAGEVIARARGPP